LTRLARPAGPPPIMLELRLEGLEGVVHLELDAGAEPDAARRIAEIADARGYDGQPLTRKPAWVVVSGIADEGRWDRLSLRRARHTTHLAGSIGWSWTKTPGDGRGGFYVMTDAERGLDAAHGIVGRVVEGLEILQAIPLTPTAIRRGQPAVEPTKIQTIRRR
jgi:cyclophilin family peptidyl-prolyl cis-trans isomerase